MFGSRSRRGSNILASTGEPTRRLAFADAMPSEDEHEVGIVGMGSMGSNLALQGVEKDLRVIGKSRSEKPSLEKKGVEVVQDYKVLADRLSPPRFVYLALPAGPVVDEQLDELVPHLEEGDVIADGGNSFWQDSVDREKRLREEGILFLDAGTSGGVDGARHGAAFMVGGREEGIRVARPVLERLSVEGGFLHTGPPGSGHFVKLVHNGIEFGMLQAIAEGAELLDASAYDLDLAEVFEHWTHGTVIRSWLVELMAQGLKEHDLDAIENFVEDTGEVNWLAMWALKQEVPIPVITMATMELLKSRGHQDQAYRSIALMRHGFGDHPFGPDEDIETKREDSRVGPL